MNPYIVNYKAGQSDTTRPWGTWLTTAVGHYLPEEGALAFCNKIITVNPGAELSIQQHEFRQEAWKITQGKAVVSLGETPNRMKPIELVTGDIIHIPCGVWHCIKNTGDKPIEFHEHQSGIYLDEEDIIRHPTKKDQRTTNEAAMARIRAEVIALGLKWPLEAERGKTHAVFTDMPKYG